MKMGWHFLRGHSAACFAGSFTASLLCLVKAVSLGALTSTSLTAGVVVTAAVIFLWASIIIALMMLPISQVLFKCLSRVSKLTLVGCIGAGVCCATFPLVGLAAITWTIGHLQPE